VVESSLVGCVVASLHIHRRPASDRALRLELDVRMTGSPKSPQNREHVLRLSHRLVALHAAGVVILILVVLSTVLWISREHNRLALEASQDLVRGGIQSFRVRLLTLVRDYSIWDEAYRAVIDDDRDWLYSNIGNAAGEIGTLDLIVFVNPATGSAFGWRAGSPTSGETGLLPEPLLDSIRGMLEGTDPGDGAARTLIADFEGVPWAFSVARVTPVDGAPAGVDRGSLPQQVHGLRFSEQRLKQVGGTVLVDDLALAAAPEPEQAAVPLLDRQGQVVQYVVWDPPRPGASILQRVAVPLGVALLIVTLVSAISSAYTVRSARRLERALYDARAADRSKTEFLSNVSHELRTPMNGILGVAQLLETTDLDAEQRELVAVLFSSANAQMALISDLLDFSRLEGGNRRLVEEPFRPADILKDVAEMMRVAGDRKGIALGTDWEGVDGLTLKGDARAVRQIVTNLVGNAVKFTDRGRVGLQAEADRDGDRVRLTVRVTDTGRGIPAESQARIFERFYQVDGSLTRSTEGTGLGLAISRSLARMMGGDVTVASRLGVGSTFTLTVPFAILAEQGPARDAA
jgi:signal transduction histidine kinase